MLKCPSKEKGHNCISWFTLLTVVHPAFCLTHPLLLLWILISFTIPGRRKIMLTLHLPELEMLLLWVAMAIVSIARLGIWTIATWYLAATEAIRSERQCVIPLCKPTGLSHMYPTTLLLSFIISVRKWYWHWPMYAHWQGSKWSPFPEGGFDYCKDLLDIDPFLSF